MTLNPLEAVAGFLLLFVVPGYAVTRAVFPEWRMRGPAALATVVQIATLSFVTSIVLTILVGFVLLQGPTGFQAGWSDPWLEGILGAVALVAGVVGLLRGAYRREPPAAPKPEPSPGEAGGWELIRELERTERERRRVAHELRKAPPGSREAGELQERRRALEIKSAELRRARESDLAG